MAWKQKVWPNLDNDPKNPLYVKQGGKTLTDWQGWCLATVHASYRASGSSYSAKTAWQANNTKHRDWNIPDGLYVPVWWEGGTYGHVAIVKRTGSNAIVYTSPIKSHKATFEVYQGEIKSILNWIGSYCGIGGYSGWTETVLNTSVLEYVADTPKKSNEEICAEIWAGEWGTGNDRKTRLTNAGYDYNTIQRMVDAGVGKPQPKPQPQPAPQKPAEAPKPEEPKEDTSKPAEAQQKGSDDVKEPIEEASSEPTTLDNGNTSLENKNDDKNTEAQDEGASAENNLNENEGEKMEGKNKEEEKVFEPIEADAQLIQSVIEEAGSFFQPSDKTKLVVYIVIDILLGVGLIIPEITNIVLANTMALKASFASTALIKLGVYLALVFKLIKKKK